MTTFKTFVLYILELLLIAAFVTVPIPHSTKSAYVIMLQQQSPSLENQTNVDMEIARLKRERFVIQLIVGCALVLNTRAIYKRGVRPA